MESDKYQAGGQPKVSGSRGGSGGPAGGGETGGQEVISEGLPEEVMSGVVVGNV